MKALSFPLRRFRGFTLIELMIALAIVAILALVALPAYNDQIRKGRRVDATSALTALQLLQEKYRSDNASYGTLDQIGGTSTSPDGYYALSVTASTASYTLTAAPVSGKSQAQDSACGSLTLVFSAGNTVYGPSNSCWGR